MAQGWPETFISCRPTIRGRGSRAGVGTESWFVGVRVQPEQDGADARRPGAVCALGIAQAATRIGGFLDLTFSLSATPGSDEDSTAPTASAATPVIDCAPESLPPWYPINAAGIPEGGMETIVVVGQGAEPDVEYPDSDSTTRSLLMKARLARAANHIRQQAAEAASNHAGGHGTPNAKATLSATGYGRVEGQGRKTSKPSVGGKWTPYSKEYESRVAQLGPVEIVDKFTLGEAYATASVDSGKAKLGLGASTARNEVLATGCGAGLCGEASSSLGPTLELAVEFGNEGVDVTVGLGIVKLRLGMWPDPAMVDYPWVNPNDPYAAQGYLKW